MPIFFLPQRYPGKSTTYPFLPTMEVFPESAILSDHPQKLLKNTRKIPLIVGMNDKEGGNMFMKGNNNAECRKCAQICGFQVFGGRFLDTFGFLPATAKH